MGFVMGRTALAAAAIWLGGCASAPARAPDPGPAATPAPVPAEPTAPVEPVALFRPDDALALCPRMEVSNAPANAGGLISVYRPFVRVNDAVRLATSPVSGACLTSGFGPRGGGRHKGIDLQTRPAAMVRAAAAGRVREAEFRPDYGWQVVIDHGAGVFTRYAHLAALEPGVVAGVEAPFGLALGVMGNTAGYAIPVHLHYEVLVGDYETQKKSFGLTPLDVFGLPAADAQG